MARRISVIVCAKNEEARIAAALDSARAAEPFEIIVVDGGSTDATAAIAEAKGVRLIRSGGKGLAFDRQLGADSATGELLAFIDADHRLQPDDLRKLEADLDHFGLDVIQAGVAILDEGFWCRAENDAMAVFHHQPGPRKMIGTAPTLYKREVLQETRFDAETPLMSDDADLFRRIERAGKRTFGIGRVQIAQKHEASLESYVKKLSWYGKRDAEFMRKHPDRAASMLFHLAVRYPILRPLKAIAKAKPRAIAFFWLSSAVRLSACLQRLWAPAPARPAPAQPAAQSAEFAA